jgi:hypothetical protein
MSRQRRETQSKDAQETGPASFECIALLFQGGGAPGACQAGVYQAGLALGILWRRLSFDERRTGGRPDGNPIPWPDRQFSPSLANWVAPRPAEGWIPHNRRCIRAPTR